MTWCLKCQAENKNEAATCTACGEAFPTPYTGWKYVFYMLFLGALLVGAYLLVEYLRANGYVRW